MIKNTIREPYSCMANTAQLQRKQAEVNVAAPDSIVGGKFTVLRTLTDNQTGHPCLYWQHSDHLGSASWITDTNGRAVQHLQYMPWGEEFVMQKDTSSYNARYTFSGKEKDSETGYSYFGARYYSSDLSVWLSVDPMSDKYPGMSPYSYCAGNPVRVTDPNGKEWWIDGFQYKPGQACPEEITDNSTRDKWNTMNTIYGTRNGKTVIDEMNVTGTVYKIQSQPNKGAENGVGSYLSNHNGTGGTVSTNGYDLFIGGLAHEVFHAYQDFRGQGKRSIENEVEARLFAESVAPFSIGMTQFPDADVSLSFKNSLSKLQAEYSHANMMDFIQEFKTFFSAGYEDYPDTVTGQGGLIEKFYPLK